MAEGAMRRFLKFAAGMTLGFLLCAATASSAASYVSFTTGDPGSPGDGIAVSPSGGLTNPFALAPCTDGITVTVFPADPSFVFNGPEDFVGLGISSPGG